METTTDNATPTTAAEIVAAVMEHGTLDSLKGYVMLKRLEADLENAMSVLKPAAIQKATEFGKGEHDAYGARFQVKAAAGRWDFKSLPWFASLEAKRKANEEKAKAAYQAAQRMQTIVDDETGEVIQPAVYVAGSDTVTIKLL